MASTTQNFGLTKLGPGETLHSGTGRFPSEDRDTIDQVLYKAVTHHHRGSSSSIVAPVTAPTLALSTTGGSLPSSTTLRYRYTWTDPDTGETAASPEATVTTADPLPDLPAPTYSVQTIGGDLVPGTYYYVATAYQGLTTNETKAVNPVTFEIPATTQTNSVELYLPDLPAGATGYNIYRRAPNETRYYWQGDTTEPTYFDGTMACLGHRNLPAKNTTNNTNSVTITAPSVPAGNTWTIYRTVTADYSNSFLVQLPDSTLNYIDVGDGTSTGGPPSAFGVVSDPDKVSLTDGAEVSGVLPMAQTTYPFQLEFQFPGPLAVVAGTGIWVCELPFAEIVAIRASLGRGSSPAAEPVIVNVLKGSGLTPVYTSVFTTNAQPRIEVGNQIGNRVVPNTVGLTVGDSLTVDIDQVGGGTTPTDRDLTVTVSLIAYGYPTTSFVPANAIIEPGAF